MTQEEAAWRCGLYPAVETRTIVWDTTPPCHQPPTPGPAPWGHCWGWPGNRDPSVTSVSMSVIMNPLTLGPVAAMTQPQLQSSNLSPRWKVWTVWLGNRKVLTMLAVINLAEFNMTRSQCYHLRHLLLSRALGASSITARAQSTPGQARQTTGQEEEPALLHPFLLFTRENSTPMRGRTACGW